MRFIRHHPGRKKIRNAPYESVIFNESVKKTHKTAFCNLWQIWIKWIRIQTVMYTLGFWDLPISLYWLVVHITMCNLKVL